MKPYMYILTKVEEEYIFLKMGAECFIEALVLATF